MCRGWGGREERGGFGRQHEADFEQGKKMMVHVNPMIYSARLEKEFKPFFCEGRPGK